MEHKESESEQQVWQRVFARQEAARGDDLRRLLLSVAELAGAYRMLSGSLTGQSREQVRQLYEGELHNAACLRGIAALSGQPEEAVKLWAPRKESPHRLLMACYHRTRRCMVEYMARSAESEFGCVYQKLADRAREHCAVLAQILGSISKQG